MGAEVINGTNSILWRTATNRLHFWRMSVGWARISSDSMIVPGMPRYYAAEVAFGRDLDNDGLVGAPFNLTESIGSTRLSFDRAGNLFANNIAIRSGGSFVNYQSYVAIGYTAAAAEIVNGVASIAWVTSEKKLHFWRLDVNWAQTSSDSMMVLGRPRYHAAETTFGVDSDGDG
jgi:hypothetical protein